MTLLTTTIGAYPKPDYVTVPDGFGKARGVHDKDPTQSWAKAVADLGEEAEEIFTRGTRDAVIDQVECGIDIPTDGEIRREDYINYHCRHLNGINFDRLTEKTFRTGTFTAALPTITGSISPRESFLPQEWRIAQSFTDKPVKMTLPGPMTISDTTADEFYGDPRRLGEDLADALNREVHALAEAGCRHIQIDEPLFARQPDAALAYGVENLERVVHGCPEHVVRTMHMCCGYPDQLDNPDYPKGAAGKLSASGTKHGSIGVRCRIHRGCSQTQRFVDARDLSHHHHHSRCHHHCSNPRGGGRGNSCTSRAGLGTYRPGTPHGCTRLWFGTAGARAHKTKLRNLCEAAHSIG